MSNYIVSGNDLTDIADAIRAKGETSSELVFPSGFVSAIGDIDTGGGGGGEAPEGYTRLKCLESSGAQCIDTGEYAKLTSKMKIDGHFKATGQGAYVIMGGSASPNFGMFAANNPGPAAIGAYTSVGDVTDKTTNTATWVRGVYECDASTAKVTYSEYDNTTISFTINVSSLSENQSSHICLFARGNNGAYERYAKCRIYEYWYYENDVLIQHMIPVKRNNDDTLGMYDVENDVFFTNAGSGTFTGIS